MTTTRLYCKDCAALYGDDQGQGICDLADIPTTEVDICPETGEETTRSALDEAIRYLEIHGADWEAPTLREYLSFRERPDGYSKSYPEDWEDTVSLATRSLLWALESIEREWEGAYPWER